MADIVNIHDAKTHLSRLLERVRRGATITIAKAGEPIAQLIPVGARPRGSRVREATSLPAGASGADRSNRIQRFLEEEVWPVVPADQVGRRLTREEEEAILGYGPTGT